MILGGPYVCLVILGLRFLDKESLILVVFCLYCFSQNFMESHEALKKTMQYAQI